MAEKDKNAPLKGKPKEQPKDPAADELAPAVKADNYQGRGASGGGSEIEHGFLNEGVPVDIRSSVALPIDFGLQQGRAMPVQVQGAVPVNVTMVRPEPPNIDDDPSLILNVAIRNRSEAISFNRYQEFINRVLCTSTTLGDNPTVVTELRQRQLPTGMLSNVYAYELLKSATDAFLLIECGLIPRVSGGTTSIAIEGRRNPQTGVPIVNDVPGITGAQLGRTLQPNEIKTILSTYLGSRGLPYLDLIANTLFNQTQEIGSPYCYGILSAKLEPCFLELIWSYWHEEGMLVQTINAIALRFQNKRIGNGRDPLARLELDPLRPLNNLMWGYIQDEINRLTIARRSDEYKHEYGLSLYGRAVSRTRPADNRSMFIEAFHNLLHLASAFFKEQSDTQVIPDGFPLLNAIKEVHLILAEGAHNQFGDLPWTARVEMLIQKWLLSRPEIREFLGGRIMVPYTEPWMGIVDSMKSLQGWTETSVRYFRDLGVFGEQLLLSLRYGNWSVLNNDVSAKNWANTWRPEIQGYIHAYRAATGIDLAAFTNSVRLSADSYQQPSLHLRQRLSAQRRLQLNE